MSAAVFSKHRFHFIPKSKDILMWSEECLEKVAQTVSFLMQPEESHLLLLTGEVQRERAAKLLGLSPCGFQPQHSSKLGNEFRLFTNYDPGLRLGGWEQQLGRIVPVPIETYVQSVDITKTIESEARDFRERKEAKQVREIALNYLSHTRPKVMGSENMNLCQFLSVRGTKVRGRVKLRVISRSLGQNFVQRPPSTSSDSICHRCNKQHGDQSCHWDR
ncbi:hypothetical protein RJ639_006616 [Escallonia herrerae]|uniref:Uncharacterized protein n=1 Tax=Escallonia herrerae TaxID=1293975 RepID=A0AA88VUG1_9ASTE|nr:hypothetical protein RJ639_006616 [Escallonia herrerae]